MPLTTGEHSLGPSSGRLLIRTGRAGLGRSVGHDLTIEVTRWSATATVEDDPAGSSVAAEIETGSFEVREGVGGVKPLTSSDKAEILRNIRDKVLKSREHPTITFRSTSVEGTPEAFTVEGDLTIKGVTRPATVRGQVSGDRLTGSATVVQTHWGIKPYSALLGQLKVADPVEIEFDLEVPADAA
jgi:polyisoprenoid-binding protein YceI